MVIKRCPILIMPRVSQLLNVKEVDSREEGREEGKTEVIVAMFEKDITGSVGQQSN